MSVNLAAVCTMNPALLKELSLEDVLKLHPLLDHKRFKWVKAQKTKPIKVKPISQILHDESVMAKIVLATLEGHEAVRANGYVCWGVDNDVWQQKEKPLHEKYKPISIDPDGWIHMEPKPNNPVDAFQILDSNELGEAGGFSVINPDWGDERVMDGKKVWLQYGIAKDYVLRTADPNDVYRVARKFFDNTYDIL